MDPNTIMKNATAGMKQAVDHTLHEFSSLHTGKATPAMLDSVRVSAYGSTVSLKEIAAVTTPDARTIMVQPWDKSVIRDIEKAIQEANLGLNPIIDGGILRVPVPELTGQRRQDLAKTAGSMAEEGRVRVRQVRRESIDQIKAAQKDGLSEDEAKRLEKEVQKETDSFISEINDHLANKEKDLKQV